MNELNHTNGKGDKERSPGWRNNYPDINFHRGEKPDGFARRGVRQVKCYTPGRTAKFVFAEAPAPNQPAGAINPHDWCRAVSPAGGYHCTRQVGHCGPHQLVCCPGTAVLEEWPNQDESLASKVSQDMLQKGIKL
jgi:hypothetical protein